MVFLCCSKIKFCHLFCKMRTIGTSQKNVTQILGGIFNSSASGKGHVSSSKHDDKKIELRWVRPTTPFFWLIWWTPWQHRHETSPFSATGFLPRHPSIILVVIKSFFTHKISACLVALIPSTVLKLGSLRCGYYHDLLHIGRPEDQRD